MSAPVKLTVRQTQVAILYGRGYSCLEIARELDITRVTVIQHLRAARLLVGAKNSAQLAVMVALLRGKG